MVFWFFLNLALPEKEWTIMVYMNGDNTLNDAINLDADEMERIGSNEKFNIIIQADGIGTQGGYNDRHNNYITEVRRYYIERGNSVDYRINSSPIQKLGELDMCSPTTIINFAKWGIENYPAKHYFLILWDHGEGWTKGEEMRLKHYGPDVTNESDLSVAGGELRQAMAGIKDYLGRNLDILGFDACLMSGVSVAYEVKDYVTVFIASEEFEGGDGWEYHMWLEELEANPTFSPQELAKVVVRTYINCYTGTKWNATLAAMNMKTEFINLVHLIDHFAGELIKTGGRWDSKVREAMENTERYSWDSRVRRFLYDGYRDLYDFATNIINQNITHQLTLTAQNLQEGFGYPPEKHPDSTGKFLVYQGDVNSWVVDSSHGVWAHLPLRLGSGYDTSLYKKLRFAGNTLWDEFILGRREGDLSSIVNVGYLMYSAAKDTYFYYVKHLTGGDDDGVPDPGEECSFYLWLYNSGGKDVADLSVTLSSLSSNVEVISGSSNFPELGGNFSKVCAEEVCKIKIKNNAKKGEWMDFQLTIKADNKVITYGFPIQIGVKSLNAYHQYYVEEMQVIKEIGLNVYTTPDKVIIYYFLPVEGLSLNIYNVMGRLQQKVSCLKKEGRVVWNIREVASGVYFCVIKGKKINISKKIILLH